MLRLLLFAQETKLDGGHQLNGLASEKAIAHKSRTQIYFASSHKSSCCHNPKSYLVFSSLSLSLSPSLSPFCLLIQKYVVLKSSSSTKSSATSTYNVAATNTISRKPLFSPLLVGIEYLSRLSARINKVLEPPRNRYLRHCTGVSRNKSQGHATPYTSVRFTGI